MTPEEFVVRMKDIYVPEKGRKYYDEERAHGEADDLMCDLLTALGYSEGVRIFQESLRWYA